MNGVLVDSNVVLDLFLNDLDWVEWSESILDKYSIHGALYINHIIYTEVSIGFDRIEDLESAINRACFRMLEIPKEALFLAGKAYLKYKKGQGIKKSTLPDFYIGAHAAVMNMDLVTRDVSRYRAYFPRVRLISPASSK